MKTNDPEGNANGSKITSIRQTRRQRAAVLASLRFQNSFYNDLQRSERGGERSTQRRAAIAAESSTAEESLSSPQQSQRRRTSVSTSPEDVTEALDRCVRSKVPGLQYVVVDADGALFEHAGGWADIRNRRAMKLDTTLMAYSMTKTFTAVAILQLAEQGKLGLDDEIDYYLPDTPYIGHHITIRQLLGHTSGIPNPIPLRWVHLAEEDEGFDEDAALAQVLRDNPKLIFEPGQKCAYSNIGYWLLGKIIERATSQSYPNYVITKILMPLGISAQEMDFVILDPARHANGYLAKYSLTNMVKRFVIDSKFRGKYEGNWLCLKSHQLNGPAFGGLIGTARGFARFLQDQLRTESVLFGPETKRLMETRQKDRAGEPIPMTLGWHVGEKNGDIYFFKEGGGGGFHSEMRLYPAKGVASVVMVNCTQFNSARFLNRMDRMFCGSLCFGTS